MVTRVTAVTAAVAEADGVGATVAAAVAAVKAAAVAVAVGEGADRPDTVMTVTMETVAVRGVHLVGLQA